MLFVAPLCIQLLSGSMIVLTITLKFKKILENISRKDVAGVLINIPPSNIFPIKHLPKRFYQNCQAVFAAVSINGF